MGYAELSLFALCKWIDEEGDDQKGGWRKEEICRRGHFPRRRSLIILIC